MSALEFWVNLGIHAAGIAACSAAVYWLPRLIA